MNQDPIAEAGGINLYGFVSNFPTGGTDPWGLDDAEDELDRLVPDKKCSTAGIRPNNTFINSETGETTTGTGLFYIMGKDLATQVTINVAGGIIVRGVGVGANMAAEKASGPLKRLFCRIIFWNKTANYSSFFNKHHPWPKYLGGPTKQELDKLPTKLHSAYHKGLDKQLPRWRSEEYYKNLPPAVQAQYFDIFQEYTKQFDSVHKTHLWDAIKKVASAAL